MRVFIESDGEEKEEIPPIDSGKVNEKDKATVKKPNNPSETPRIPQTVKELVALDAFSIGPKRTAEVHGITVAAAKTIAYGTEEGRNAQAVANMEKYGIADLATAKLMQTLHLLDPDNITKETDKIHVIAGLSKVLDNMNDKSSDGQKTVHLHLYAPNQKEERDYPIIEVA